MKNIIILIVSLYCMPNFAQTVNASARVAAIEARMMPQAMSPTARVTPATRAFQSGYPEASYNSSLSSSGPGSGIGAFGDVAGPEVAPRSKNRSVSIRRLNSFSMLPGTKTGVEFPGDSPPIPGYEVEISARRGKNYMTEGIVDPYAEAENVYTKGN